MNARQYRREQDKALAALLRKIRQLYLAMGVPITDAQREAMALLLLRSVRGARERNYRVAQAYIASQVVGAAVPDLPFYPLESLVRSLEFATDGLQVNQDAVTAANRRDPRIVDTGRKAAAGAIARQAQEPARSTVQNLAESTDGIGWARMLTGPTSCSFCAMLASRGAVYSSRESAVGRGGNPMNLYHTAYLNKNGKLVGGDCDCIAVIVHAGGSFEGAAAAESLENLWQDSTRRKSNKDARNAFRREWDRKVRGGETGEYLADTIKR